jgi:hypothetical protein
MVARLPAVMDNAGLYPTLSKHGTEPYSEHVESISHLHNVLLRDAFELILMGIFKVGSFPEGVQLTCVSRIWGSHGGEYEGGCLLGCSAV